jgi:crotonobetainyl-CoA:carnitine CoA-transferase CaiB-like acyl-CoA transferase
MGKPLEGVKVVEFSWVIAGPQVSRCLADFGATVIKVESNTYPDLIRTTPPYKDGIPGVNRSGYFSNFNCNKYGVSLNLNHPKGVDIAKRLISWADIVVENFAPGRMRKWGLNYEELVKIKPEIIMISLAIQGQTGPHAHHPGFAFNAEALAGFYHLTGWADRMPSLAQGFYGDVLTPRLGLCAVLAALDYRRRTGKGQYLDISQFEVAGYFLAPLLLDYFVNGREAHRMGNRSLLAAPHGVYPCLGEDRWCALSVCSDEEWQGLCRAMGDPQWCKEPKFATPLSRKANEEELDKLISSWTKNFPPEELMLLLQKEGVAAGVVSTNRDLSNDPQLRHRDAVWYLHHPEMGLHGYDNWSFELSLTPAEGKMPAPCLGEHNEYVYTQILGLSQEEFITLLNEGVFD